MTIRTIVTVGAGQAAAGTARTLRRKGFDGRIVLVGNEPHDPYQRPPLSKEFLTEQARLPSDRNVAATPVDLALLTPKWRAANDIEILTGTTVTRIDTSTRTVTVEGSDDIVADAVVLATGGSPRTLTTTGSRTDLVHYLRTLDDATALGSRLVSGARLIVVGGGFIGLEVAATAVGLGVDVTVIEGASHLLAAQLGISLGRMCADLHRSNGVRILTGIGVTAMDTSDIGVRVTTTAGDVLEADAVVVGIGIEPRVDVAAASGLRTENGIIVDTFGRTQVPEIFAVGDVANRWSDSAGRHVRVEHFDNANRQSAVVANAILGREIVEDGPHWFWSDQYNVNIQFTGHTTDSEPIVRGDITSGEFCAFYLDGTSLAGAFAMNRGEDIMASRELIGATVNSASLTDESIDLWELTEEVATP